MFFWLCRIELNDNIIFVYGNSWRAANPARLVLGTEKSLSNSFYFGIAYRGYGNMDSFNIFGYWGTKSIKYG
jgi:hypothetical protein